MNELLELTDRKKRFKEALASVESLTGTLKVETDVFERMSLAQKLKESSRLVGHYSVQIWSLEEDLAEEERRS